MDKEYRSLRCNSQRSGTYNYGGKLHPKDSVFGFYYNNNSDKLSHMNIILDYKYQIHWDLIKKETTIYVSDRADSKDRNYHSLKMEAVELDFLLKVPMTKKSILKKIKTVIVFA